MSMRETEWMRTFGQNLKELMNEQNVTERQLARKIGVSQPTVNGYIHGRVMPSVKSLVNIYYVLNCDVNDIFDFGDKIGLD